MSERALQECRILLLENISDCSGQAASYAAQVPVYASMNNRALIRYNIKAATEYLKAAIRSFNELEALDLPAELREAAE
jgi:hypothetical protein